MIPVNRDTLLMFGTIICAVGIIFLFRELNKTKEEIDNFKSFSVQVIKHLNKPPTPVKIEPEKVEEEVEEKTEE